MSPIRDKMLSLANRIEERAAQNTNALAMALTGIANDIRAEFGGVIKSVVHIDCSKPKKRKRR